LPGGIAVASIGISAHGLKSACHHKQAALTEVE
jgi:hypothetical protein